MDRPPQLQSLQENVSGMTIVQLVPERSDRRCNDSTRSTPSTGTPQLRGVRYDSIFSALAELVGSITLAAIVWAGGWGVLGGLVTFGTLVAFIEYAAKFFGPVQELSQRYTVMQSAMAAAERVFGLLDTEITIGSPPQSLAPPRAGSVGRDRFRERDLRLRGG